MNSEWLKTRQTKFTAYATIYILIVIAVLGLINWLANRHNKSVDTTSNKRFSLSDQTKKVVSNLKQDVKVTYFDKTSSFTQAKDLLERYETLSPKLSVDYVDPDKKPQVAKSMGVKSYGTIMVDSGAKHQEAKSLTEEEVTGAVIRTLKGGDRSVCVVSGSGEHALDDTGRSGYSGIKEQIEKNNYKTRAISLLDKPEVPKDCTITLVAGPRFDYVEPVVNALKTYQQNGGRLLVLLDPPVKLGKEDVSENAALAKVIDGWGVTLNKDLVLDTSGVGQIFGFSEVVPLVTTYESHPIVREMKGIATAFPLTRSLDVKTGAEKLFSTSENSFSTTKLDAKEIRIDPAKDKHGPFVLGAAGSVKAGEGQARFVVVGSSGWVANSIVSFNGNKDLFLNMLNWLSADEELISIRPKDPEDRRITMNRLQMQMVFYSSVLLLPLMIVVAGFGVYWRRR
jgi:ABC-type uncharacterized transport system involved in gliding motility auxiliary subunit